mmetsp:Transcript_4857/g.6784  ORF Transcript_4857/g.6784 Transcript_4857/m.6784 type:complete len:382 (+) Transcript_4857:28-1173(+)
MASESDNEAGPIKTYSLEDNLDLLSEKSGATREIALEAIFKELKNQYHEEFVTKSRLTLLDALKKSLRKGSAKERKFGALCVAMTSVTLGADDDELYKEFKPIFSELISPQNTGVSEETKATLAESLAMICLVSADENETLNVINELFAVIQHHTSNNELIAAGVRAWSLLVSTISQSTGIEPIVEQALQTLLDLLKNEDVDVRVAAGEAVALLVEKQRDVEEDNFELRSFADIGQVDVDDLLDSLHELASDKTKMRARKDKLKQRLPFKEIVASVEEGIIPTEILSFKHQKFTFENWEKLIQLDAVRELLAEGLQTHFENNPLLHQIFDISLDKQAKKTQLSSVEKRLMMSPSSPMSKARTQNRSKQRELKGNQHNGEEV